MKEFSSGALEDNHCCATKGSTVMTSHMPATGLRMPRNAFVTNKCFTRGTKYTKIDWLNWTVRQTSNLKVVGSSPTLVAFDLSVYNLWTPQDQPASDLCGGHLLAACLDMCIY